MGIATNRPQWWAAENHDSAWERVKESMRRDWEQTKADFSGNRAGTDLDQDVDDTVKQAAGKQAIPPANVPNAPDAGKSSYSRWDDVEGPLSYGYGARTHYKDYSSWDDKLEGTLRKEWETSSKGTSSRWDDVKPYVRRGFEARH